MDNPEEVLHCLDEFAKLKPKDIPRELEEYLMYVARTGDPVYQWPLVKCLFREKLLNVITEFYETTPTLDLPPSPNVDVFNYENMKRVLLERLEAFSNAPFTVQRLCELLTTPRKEYNRPDKFMRAIEKNILVVSTREPGNTCRPDSALSEPLPNGVSESVETANIQSINNDSVNEENVSEPSQAAPVEDSRENHVAVKPGSGEQSNVVDSVISESIDERVETAAVAGETSVNLTKEVIESSVAVDTNETSNVDVDNSISKSDIHEEMPDSASDPLSPQVDSAASTDTDVALSSSAEPADTPSVSSSSPKKTTDTSKLSIAETIAEDILAEAAAPSETVTECTGSIVDDRQVKESVSDSDSTHKKSSEINENVTDSREIPEVCDQSVHVEKEIVPAANESSEGKPVEEDRTQEEVVNLSQADEKPKLNEATPNSGTVKDSDEGKPQETTVTPTDMKSAPEPCPLSEEPDKKIETPKAEEHPLKVVEIEPMKAEEVAAVVSTNVLSESNISPVQVDRLFGAVDVTSTEKSAAVNQACEEEAMDVDEGSNQPTEPSEAEAMAVAEDAEPMDDSDQPAVEEMS